MLYLYLSVVLSIYGLITLTRFIRKQGRLYQTLAPIPGPNFRSSLLGNFDRFWYIFRNNPVEEFGSQIGARLSKWSDKYGNKAGLYRLWLGPFIPYVIVTDPKLGKKIFSSPNFIDKSSLYKVVSSVAGNGMFTCKGSDVKRQREIVKPFFQLSSLETYMDNSQRNLRVMNEIIDDRIRSKESGHFANVEELVSHYILDSVGENLFGKQFHSSTQGKPQILRVMTYYMHNSFEFMVMQPWTFNYWDNKILILLCGMVSVICENAVKNLTRIGIVVVHLNDLLWELANGARNRLAAIKESSGKGTKDLQGDTQVQSLPAKPAVLLDAFYCASDSSSNTSPSWWNTLNRLPVLLNNFSTFVMAGYDTTTCATTWLLYLLAHHPEPRRKLTEEIDGFLATHNESGEPVKVSNLKNLKYLDACIKEQLRMVAIASFLGRTGSEPFVVNDHITIPANIEVIYFNHYVNMSERYFRDPKRFNPDRFLTNSSEHESAPEALVFPAFGAGGRLCPGKEYALMQIKLFFVNVLSRYEIEPVEPYDLTKAKIGFFRAPAEFPLRFRRRPETTF